MKKINLFLFALAIGFTSANAQTDNPYAIFGYEGKVLKTQEEESGHQFLLLNTNDTTQILKSIIFNTEKGRVEYIDHQNNIFKSDSLMPTLVLRFLSTDPHAKDYPNLNPYNFVGNMPIRAVDPDGRDIYILFATTGNQSGDAMFNAAAETRRKNIESSGFFDPSKDQVVVLQVSDVGQIKSLVEQTVTDLSGQYGPTREVGVWSHAARQGPIGTEPSSVSPTGYNQMDYSGGWDDINFNWSSSGASMTFYGCNTGNELNTSGEWQGSFARNISSLPNFSGVQVSGQSTSSYPSFSPVVRQTNIARSAYSGIGFSIGDTYMVGGNPNQGSDAMWFTPASSPAANPMNTYEDGRKVGSGLQSTGSSHPVNR